MKENRTFICGLAGCYTDFYVRDCASYLDAYFYATDFGGPVDLISCPADGTRVGLPDSFEERMFVLESLDGLVNLCPHPVTLCSPNGETWELPPTGIVARCTQTQRKVGEKEVPGFGIMDIMTTDYGETTGLPEPKDGVLYIVSALAAKGAPGRDDLVVPCDTVRGDNGNIIGCRSLARIAGV